MFWRSAVFTERRQSVSSEAVVSHSQFGGLYGEAFGQCGEALVAAAHHGVQTGTLSRTPQHRGAAVVIFA